MPRTGSDAVRNNLDLYVRVCFLHIARIVVLVMLSLTLLHEHVAGTVC